MAKGDSVAAMEAFAHLAAKRERKSRWGDEAVAGGDGAGGSGASVDDEEEQAERRARAEPLLNKTAFERRKVVSVFKEDGSRGHHMQVRAVARAEAARGAGCGGLA